VNHHYNLKSLFVEVAKKYPNHVALQYEDRAYTYQELMDKSDQLAVYLLSQGLSAGHVVCIISSKVFEDYALMIACLKVGIIYTNTDSDNPLDRIASILDNCKAKMVLANFISEGLQGHLRKANIKHINYSDIEYAAGSYESTDIDGDSVAYIMFTSGSTGVPKGAAITHQNLLHFIAWATARFAIIPQDNFANISPMYFDNSVFDFYSALFNGACITPIKKSLLTQPLELVNYVTSKVCTFWFSVPTMLIYLLTMKVLTNTCLTSIRTFIFGGEGFQKTELQKLYHLYGQTAELVNVYGPTECTCICSSYTITGADFDNLDELPCLGAINTNVSYVILNEGKPGQQGELCLLGPLVSKGYYNDPDRTAGVFSFYTDGNHYSKPMYKTGDLVKEVNGLLYFNGRKDNQIKHMGYRIELEEIECALNSLPDIQQAAVVYQRVSTAFGKIIAFVVLNSDDVELAAIKESLGGILPAYMLPSRYDVLKTFPMNANGKIDKVRLKSMA